MKIREYFNITPEQWLGRFRAQDKALLKALLTAKLDQYASKDSPRLKVRRARALSALKEIRSVLNIYVWEMANCPKDSWRPLRNHLSEHLFQYMLYKAEERRMDKKRLANYTKDVGGFFIMLSTKGKGVPIIFVQPKWEDVRGKYVPAVSRERFPNVDISIERIGRVLNSEQMTEKEKSYIKDIIKRKPTPNDFLEDGDVEVLAKFTKLAFGHNVPYNHLYKWLIGYWTGLTPAQIKARIYRELKRHKREKRTWVQRPQPIQSRYFVA